jgi:TRAP transporter TAXI family solute receptor
VGSRLATALPTLAALALAGCGRGPDADALRKDVADRLAQAMPDGTLELAGFARRGSQTDTKAPAGESRCIVYFDADLKLTREFQFGAWDGPGVAGLVSAMGAGPKGIVGITSGGNRAGDVLKVHGTSVYKREEGRWGAVATGAYRPTEAPSYATNAPAGTAAILEAMRKVIEAIEQRASPAQREVIEQELDAAHATVRARLARLEQGYAVAAGPERGQYLRLVQALSGGTTTRVVALITRGGEENLRLLRAGKVSLALAQGDAALAAYGGKGPFERDGPDATLRAIGSLYPEPLHVLVRADSPFASLEDLRGKRVAIGQPGSASRMTALAALAAHGLGAPDLQTLEMAPGDALVALREGRADALLQVIGLPADAVRDALAAVPLRLLPLSEGAVAALAASGAGYFALTIPGGAYAGQKPAVRTIATAAILLAGSDLSDIEVGAITRYVFEKGRDFAARGSAQGVQVSPANARLGLSVPLHTAAERVLQELK